MLTARGNGSAWIISDMPFGSQQRGTDRAVHNAVRLVQACAHMVKLEGGGWTVPIVHALVERGIPVCAHLGFTPQSVNALGGYRVQDRGEPAARAARADRGARHSRRRDARAGDGAGATCA